MTDDFWKRKSLSEMSTDEWESLCDGCGLCCLHKLEDEEAGEVYFTDIACKLLDMNSCRCTNYKMRAEIVPSCVVLSADQPSSFDYLPDSCAYRLLANDQPLPDWHPLVSGDAESVHRAGISMKGKAVSENDTTQWSVLRQLSK